MNKQRLLDLVAANRKVPAQRFAMKCWADKVSCPTVACAAGNYVAAYPDRGLKLVQFPTFLRSPVMVVIEGPNRENSRVALGKHFGISIREVEFLFFPRAYRRIKVKKTDVIRRVLRFIKTNGRSAAKFVAEQEAA